jgi:hypothetical protein
MLGAAVASLKVFKPSRDCILMVNQLYRLEIHPA